MCVRERERKREREKERERLSQTVCQNCEMHYLPAWARWLLNEILTGHWEHRFLIQLQWCVCEKKTSIQTVWRWWERESGEDEWVKSRQKIERERKKREFLWRIVCVWEKTIIQTVWRWWERESGEDEWVKSRQKIERERKKIEFWRIVVWHFSWLPMPCTDTPILTQHLSPGTLDSLPWVPCASLDSPSWQARQSPLQRKKILVTSDASVSAQSNLR